jgi:hypothetical protein
MKKTTTTGHIKDGLLITHHREKFVQSVACLSDGQVKITVERVYRKRSLCQNSYYWGVIVNEFVEGYKDTTGEKISAENAHECLKMKCNGIEITNKETGEILTVGQSTAEMTTVQTMEYYEACIRFIAEFFGRAVPAPNEQLTIEN